jgi:Transglycosylase-like domain
MSTCGLLCKLGKEKRMRNIAMATLIVTVFMIVSVKVASAHEITRSQCRQYAQINAVTLNPDRPSGRTYRRSFRRCMKSAAKHNANHPLPASSIPPILRRIRGCESGHGPSSPPNYRAQNRSSTASGAYQALDSTWGNHAGYRKARLAPPRIQDKWAMKHFRENGSTPWVSSRHCWG